MSIERLEIRSLFALTAQLLADINPGSVSSLPRLDPDITVVNDVAYFKADDGKSGSRLWKTDGTAAGTVGLHGAPIDKMVNLNGTLIFPNINGLTLWKNGGTVEEAIPLGLRPRSPANINGTLFFKDEFESDLWKSDGTTAGTVLVKSGFTGGFSGFTNVNGTLFFVVGNGARGNNLWKSDGTTSGTVLVKDIQVGGSRIQPANVNGKLFFVANDLTHGSELWESDGTEAGTVLVKDIR